MKNATRGVAVRGINIGDVRVIQIPLPSLEEQKETIRRVEVLFAFAERIDTRLSTARAVAF
jgi:type I restriction enzyme S subunit